VPYDYHRLLYTLRVVSSSKETGIFRPPHRWDFSGGITIVGVGSSRNGAIQDPPRY
jgi:hypothetical protein